MAKLEQQNYRYKIGAVQLKWENNASKLNIIFLQKTQEGGGGGGVAKSFQAILFQGQPKQTIILFVRASQIYVVYFDQLLGAARTLKLVEILYFSRFQPFLFISNIFSDFTPEINKKV